jgi:DNA-binding NtrC family response regulator
VDVRVVAATNQELELAVAEGRFRSDLYHRLSQITLRVPPLRKRTEDIAPLAIYFLEQQDPRMRFSDAALDVLISHSWPGNIRELRNVVTKAALLSQEQTIVPEDLPLAAESPDFSNGHNGNVYDNAPYNGIAALTARSGNDATRDTTVPARGASLEGMERRMILEALHATSGHQQKAAARLGISRRTLSRKLKLYEAERAGAPV